MIIYFDVDTTSLLNMQRVPHKTYVGQEIVNIFQKSNGAIRDGEEGSVTRLGNVK